MSAHRVSARSSGRPRYRCTPAAHPYPPLQPAPLHYQSLHKPSNYLKCLQREDELILKYSLVKRHNKSLSGKAYSAKHYLAKRTLQIIIWQSVLCKTLSGKAYSAKHYLAKHPLPIIWSSVLFKTLSIWHSMYCTYIYCSSNEIGDTF